MHLFSANPTAAAAGVIRMTGGVVRYIILRMIAREEWEGVRDTLTHREHVYYQALDTEEHILFRELSLAFAHVALGELRHAKGILERILRLNNEEGRAQLLYAYVHLIENDSEKALMRYTALLARKEFQLLIKAILKAIQTTSSVYELTLQKPRHFFYIHYRRTWGARLAYYGGGIWGGHRSSGKWWRYVWGVVIMGVLIGGVLVVLGLGSGRLGAGGDNKSRWLERWALGLERYMYKWKLSDATELLGGQGGDFAALTWENAAAPAHDNNGNRSAGGDSGDTTTGGRASQAIDYQGAFREMKAAIRAADVNAAIVIYNDVRLAEPVIGVMERFNILKTFIAPSLVERMGAWGSLAMLRKEPGRYVGTYWELEGEVLGVRQLGGGAGGRRSDLARSNERLTGELALAALLAWGEERGSDAVLELLVVRGGEVRQVMQIFFGTGSSFPRVGERYRILGEYMGIDRDYQIYMQGLRLQRLP